MPTIPFRSIAGALKAEGLSLTSKAQGRSRLTILAASARYVHPLWGPEVLLHVEPSSFSGGMDVKAPAVFIYPWEPDRPALMAEMLRRLPLRAPAVQWDWNVSTGGISGTLFIDESQVTASRIAHRVAAFVTFVENLHPLMEQAHRSGRPVDLSGVELRESER